MSPDNPPSGDLRSRLGVSAALVVLTLLVYWPSLHHPFVNYDDPDYVYQNPHVQSGLTVEGFRWAFSTFECGNWHPLTWLSLQLDASMYGGMNPGGFHRTNVLLHAANALLLFLVLHRMTAALGRSAIVSALFAVHPLHVESVAWVAERKDVLSAFFGLLALAAYEHYVNFPSIRRYVAILLALALSLLAKPMLVTLPFVLLLLDYWPLHRWRCTASFHPLVWEKLPLLLLVTASCVVTVLAQMRSEAMAPLEALPLAARLGNALLAYVGYLGKMLWPTHLAVYYPHLGPDISLIKVLIAGLVLTAITVLVLGPGRRWRYLAVGWLWYLGTLLPVIGLVQVGGQSMADRYSYVPLIGLFLMLTWGFADFATTWRLSRTYLTAAAVVALSGCVVLSWMQIDHWKSSLDLWKQCTDVTENNFLANLNLGVCYLDRGMFSDAKRAFAQAAEIDPLRAEPHINLGNVYQDLGMWERAAAEYRTAIDLAPQLAGPHVNLGHALAQLDRSDEAMAVYRRAIELNPNDPSPHNNLAIQLGSLGRWREAEAEYRAALTLDSGNASVHGNLGRLLVEMGRLEEALVELRESLELGDKSAQIGVPACEYLLALRRRLPDLIAGRDRPVDNAERLAFADVCRLPSERRFVVAVRLYSEAFRIDPALVGDRPNHHRYHAAAAAAAAGCGLDATAIEEREKARLRHQARMLLQADLDLWIERAQGNNLQMRGASRQMLRMWQRDALLAGVRDAAALEKLPEAERQAWRKLWREVETVLARIKESASLPNSARRRDYIRRCCASPRSSRVLGRWRRSGDPWSQCKCSCRGDIS